LTRGRQSSLTTIISAYPSLITRAYCVVRFRIIKGRFLEEIGQFLPRNAKVLEVGCGFGLFSLYFARTRPDLTLHGFDIDEARVRTAEGVRGRLGLTNVTFAVGDASRPSLEHGIDAVYMLDIVHHIPHAAAVELIDACYRQLRPGGVLIVKDVDTRPRYKMAFTWLLDVLMTKGDRPEYWSRSELLGVLGGAGFDVVTYAMVDLLPYPHQLYVATKPVLAG
jgi:2-polyprenyl-6-hydroxyphenyl methylase/3-demethylubiquinone-9 3-methyltransferase